MLSRSPRSRVLWLTAAGQSTAEWQVVSAGDSGAGTLRWAITEANASAGDDLIRFDSAMTIRPQFALPALADDGITIDASDPTNGEASPDTAPRVWLDGALAGDAAGLELIAARGVVRGLGVVGFTRYGIGVIGVDATEALIEGNWIGWRPDGAAAANRLSGVAVLGGAASARVVDNRIGGNSVPGRTGHGVLVGGGGSVDALIADNVIGIGSDGSRQFNDDGILIVDSAQATIRGNTIGNSRVAGIELRETGLAIAVDGNRIGLRRDAALAPNDVGLFLGPASALARVGSEAANAIAGNRVGVAVEQGAREALIENNWVGLAPRGDAPRGDAAPAAADLPAALIRPNQERGVSVIAGAAEIQVRNNYVAAGDFGIVVADLSTTRVSLTRNVVAGSRQSPTEAAIDIRAGTEVTIGGDAGYGNHVCGAEFGIRLANTEAAAVNANAVGVGAASRITFDSDDAMRWGIRLDDQVVRAEVSGNFVAAAAQAAISVVGAGSQDNSLSGNRYGRNGIDIDLGADGPNVNDEGDADSGPNQLLNHPLIEEHQVARIADRLFRSTITGQATPGSYVEIYMRDGEMERRIARSGRADAAGNWTATTAEVPHGRLRALATRAAGATSEFSPSFTPAQRVRLNSGEHWFAWTGPAMPVAEALAPLTNSLETVWVYDASADATGRWRGWLPQIPSGFQGSLETLHTGDVLRIQLSGRPPRDFFVPSGGDLESLAALELRQGFNSVSWLGETVPALDTLARLEASQPRLIDSVWQWDGQSWQLIWPRLRGAWDPGQWLFPALWIRATDDGQLPLH